MKLKRREKPAYLRYKRGRITEKERTERVELSKAFIEENKFDEQSDQDLQRSPLSKWKGWLMAGMLVVFLFVFAQTAVSYTKGMYGERTDTEPLKLSDLGISWSLSLSGDDNEQEQEDSKPDIPIDAETSIEQDERTPLVMDRPSISVYPDAFSKESTDTQELNVDDQSPLISAVAIHENLIVSLERIKTSVLRFDSQQANWMNVQSRLGQELAFYEKALNALTTQSEQPGLSDSKKHLLGLLTQQVDDLHAEVSSLSNSTRSTVVADVNQLIENENNRRAVFLDHLMNTLDELNMPYSFENGSLTF